MLETTQNPVDDTGQHQIHHRICPLCEACCGLEIKTQGKHIVSIRGHEVDVFSHGFICPKGVALKDLHEDPDRLRTPLIKRQGVHVRASWEEAFAEIERRLPPIMAQHGKHSVGLVAGNPTSHKMGLMLYFAKLARALGSRNVFSASTLDQIPRQLVCGWMYGHWLSVPVPDISRCDYLLIIGANPMASNGSMWTVPDFRGKAKAMHSRGGRMVVIDPRRSETAALAQTLNGAHHFIRPGADVFFLAAMVHVLFEENLVKTGHLSNWLVGMDEVKAVVIPFSPEVVAERCAVSAQVIRVITRQLATTPRAAVYGRIGTCTQEFGTLSSWLIDVLNALTGHLDTPGGVMFPKAAAFAANTMGQSGKGSGIPTGRAKSRVSAAPEVMGELPISCMAEEIEIPGEGQIRALITQSTNPVLSAPNGARLSRALEKLDFMVSLDIYLNETTRHADVILPGLSPLEESHYDIVFNQLSQHNQARYSHPIVAPNEQLPEWQSLLRLAAIVQGQGANDNVVALDDAQFSKDAQRQLGERAQSVIEATAHLQGPERQLDMALRLGPYGDQFGAKPDGLTLAKLQASTATGGIDLGPLQPRIPEVLRTPSGQVELAPTAVIADMQRAVKMLREPIETNTMVIIGRRDLRSNNSWMHNLPLLAKGPNRCTALIHPDDAQQLGLQDGSVARLKNHVGQVDIEVVLSADMMPGVISLPHGWGHDHAGTALHVAAQRPGVNMNALLDENRRDPLSGNAVLSGITVSVTAVA